MQRERDAPEIIAAVELSQDSITVRIATSLEEIIALRPLYEQLHRTSGNTLPFAMHEWHVAWCRHFLNHNPRIHDEPFFLAFSNQRGDCVGIFPLIVSRRRVGPIKITTVNLVGADPGITEIGAPMIMPGYEHVLARAVQHQLARIGAWDWVHWTGITEPFGAALAANCQLQWRPTLTDYVLDLAPSWEQFRAGLKRNIRESLRHCYNSLKRDDLILEFHVAETPSEVGPALDRFFALHTMRANFTGGAMHQDLFASELFRRFLHDACRGFAESGNLRIFQLKIGGQVVATRIGLVSGDCLFLYKSGFDPEWARYSVMTTTVAEAIKYAIAQSFKTVNLSTYKEVSKTRWGPREVEYKSAHQSGSRLRSRIARQAYLKAGSGEGLPGWVLQHLAARRHWR